MGAQTRGLVVLLPVVADGTAVATRVGSISSSGCMTVATLHHGRRAPAKYNGSPLP